MPDGESAALESLEGETDPRDRLAASARGWHQIQLAVLGFIGFCGVLWRMGTSEGPVAVQWVALALVVLSFVVAVGAVLLVARVAYPVSDAAGEGASDREAVAARRSRRLGLGIRATYLAVGLVVAASLSGWLPASSGGEVVVAVGAGGEIWCGELVDEPTGEGNLVTRDGRTIPLDRVVALRPVGSC